MLDPIAGATCDSRFACDLPATATDAATPYWLPAATVQTFGVAIGSSAGSRADSTTSCTGITLSPPLTGRFDHCHGSCSLTRPLVDVDTSIVDVIVVVVTVLAVVVIQPLLHS